MNPKTKAVAASIKAHLLGQYNDSDLVKSTQDLPKAEPVKEPVLTQLDLIKQQYPDGSYALPLVGLNKHQIEAAKTKEFTHSDLADLLITLPTSKHALNVTGADNNDVMKSLSIDQDGFTVLNKKQLHTLRNAPIKIT
jgi:hypothetical protein